MGCEAVMMGEGFLMFRRISVLLSSGQVILKDDNSTIPNIGNYFINDRTSHPRILECLRIPL